MNEYIDRSRFEALLREYMKEHYPITKVLIIAISVVFIGELVATILLARSNSIRIFSTGIFGVYPWIAWPLSPVLHKGFKHFLASILFALLVGTPVEKHWNWKAYLAFLVGTGYATIIFGAGLLWLFASGQFAFYGASGIMYALAGYSFTHFLIGHEELDLTEKVAVGFGFVALLSVVLDIIIGPYFTPHWINGGHLSGFAIGVLVGFFGLNECCDKNRPEPSNSPSVITD